MRTTIEGTPRAAGSKGETRRLRAAGRVPATLSGADADTVLFSLPARPLTAAYRRLGTAALMELTGLQGGSCLAVTRSVERHPVTHELLHVEFARVARGEPLKAEVPVTLVGEPEDARTGTGVLEHEATTVQVRALPDKMPTHIEADTSKMELGGVLRASDLPPSRDYEVLSPPETILATLHTVRAAVAPSQADTEAEAGGEGQQAA